MLTTDSETRQPPANPRSLLLTRRFALEAALVLLLALAALLPRVLDLGGFIIEDEARYWLDRSYTFLNALEDGDYAATAISTHPGVSTMWSGTLGTILKRQLLAWGILQDAPFATTLALMRLPAVLAHVVGVLVGYALLRRMLPLGVAMLAALLWATDPLTVAFTRVLHVDGLMSTFALVSLLAACVYWHHRAHPAYLVLSAVCGALSVLSKSPGLIVPPLVGVIWLLAWLAPPSAEPGSREHTAGFKRQLAELLAWGAVYALTIILVWPAVWADPLRVYELLRIGVEVEGAAPHVQGNFFLGQRNDEPGLLFYPAAIALRLTPWAMLGLLALPLVWRDAPISRASRRDLLTLLVFALLFTLALSLFSKKLNRYIMPAFPALNILAAAGLVWGGEKLRRLLCRGREAGICAPHAVSTALIGIVGALALLNAAWWHPYSIAYFNQALGGAQAGPRVFLIGHGEGLEQAAAWLNQQPDITGVVAATTMKPALQPYLRHGAQASPRDGEELPRATGYVVVYVRNVWDGAVPPFDRFYQQVPPLHTVTIHGVEYAWIYEVPPPIEHEINATFGPNIELHGYEVDSSTLRATGVLSLTTQWHATAPLADEYLMFAHLIDDEGQRVAQIDAPPAGAAAPTQSWQAGRYRTWVHPIPVPPDLPPGDYWLALGLYRPEDFSRLPVSAETPPDAPAAGGNALLLPLELDE